MMRKSCIPFFGFVFLIGGLAAVGCSSDDSNPSGAGTGTAGNGPDSGASGAAGSGGLASQTSECTIDQDCQDDLPETTPANCAEAKCNRVQGKCEFLAKDADHDGHRALECSGGVVTIQTGDDCNDGDPNTYPGAWDGPGESVSGSAGAAGAAGASGSAGAAGEAGAAGAAGTGGAPSGSGQPDRCDQVDQDCDGTPDNGKNGAQSCKCDPAHPNPCFEYPNGTPIDPKLLDIGICKQGTQSCVDGVPGACIGAVGPATEVCDDQDNDCNGQTDESGTNEVEYCPDLDDDSYCNLNADPTKCVFACKKPTRFRLKSSCLGQDCADATKSRNPGAKELCGDAIDSNCDGKDSDGYPDLNSSCTAGTIGVCRRTGKMVCNTNKDGTVCNAVAGTAQGSSTEPSYDSLIDASTARSDYDPHWDWNCDNTITLDPPGPLQTSPAFKSAACVSSPNYTTACAALSQTQCSEGLFGVKFFNCENLYGYKLCGRGIDVVQCIWDWNGTGKCDYLAGSYQHNKYSMSCK